MILAKWQILSKCKTKIQPIPITPSLTEHTVCVGRGGEEKGWYQYFWPGLKGHCHEQKFNSPKTCLHHWKAINSGQVFLKLLYQCTETKYRVISLWYHWELLISTWKSQPDFFKFCPCGLEKLMKTIYGQTTSSLNNLLDILPFTF